MRLTLERPPLPSAPPPVARSARRAAMLPVALVLLAFLLRVVNLSYESFDLDEADGAAFIAASLGDLILRLFQQGENGPLYYLLLGLWSKLAGTSEFALRYPSVMFGTLLVALCYTAARRLLDRPTALLTALVAACSTYLIHYAQMLKMYALLALLALLASYLLLRALDHPTRRTWAAYVVAVSLAMYTHVFGVLLLPWHIAYVVLRYREHRPALRGWLGATALLTLPYIPLGLWHLDALKTIKLLDRQHTGPRDFAGMLATLAREYGTRYDELPFWPLAGFFLTAAGLGFLALRYGRADERRSGVGLFLGLGIIMPLTIIYVLVSLDAPLYSPRYLMITLPPFLLLWGAGLAAVARRRGLLLVPTLGLFLALNGVYLIVTDLQGVRYRENWRDAVAHVNTLAQDGDAVAILHSSVANAYGYYQDRPLPVVDLTPVHRLPEAERERALAELVQPYRRVWLVLAYFELPDYPAVRPWLEGYTHIQEEHWFRGVRVAEHIPTTPPRPATPLALSFGGRLQVLGFDQGPLPQEPGQPWQVRLYWQALQQPDTDYALSLRLVDEAGRIWGRSEGPLGGQFRHTSVWQAGQVVPDARKLQLVPGTPPGAYRLGLVVYRRDPVQNLPLDGAGDGDREFGLLDTVRLEQPIPAAVESLPGKQDIAFANGTRLLGAALPEEPVVAGYEVPLTLYWAASADQEANTNVQLRLVSPADRSVVQEAPLGTWAQPREEAHIRAQQFALPVPSRFGPGPHRLELRLRDDEGQPLQVHTHWWQGSQNVIVLGEVMVTGRERNLTVEEDLLPPIADFDDGLRLLGLRLSGASDGTVRAGSTLEVSPVWQAAGEPQGSYQVTVQLVSAAGRLIAQHDDRPAAGHAPTESWQQGEVIEDPHPLAIPPTAPLGKHRLIVAVYDPITEKRLFTRAGADAVELTTLDVVR